MVISAFMEEGPEIVLALPIKVILPMILPITKYSVYPEKIVLTLERLNKYMKITKNIFYF